ncbi:MAG: DUF1573 domain-containing protein [Ferruginibacter sp.]
MKVTKFIAAAVLAIFLMSFSSSNEAALTWKTETIDLGKIQHNKPMKVKFEFTNTSDAPVIISEVITSCGCTGADYSKAPIAAKASSAISVTYNAANVGAFSKTITVKLASDETKQLVIKGTVVE